jgi:hypothetical protein
MSSPVWKTATGLDHLSRTILFQIKAIRLFFISPVLGGTAPGRVVTFISSKIHCHPVFKGLLQLVDMRMPATDSRESLLVRCTEPDRDAALLLA